MRRTNHTVRKRGLHGDLPEGKTIDISERRREDERLRMSSGGERGWAMEGGGEELFEKREPDSLVKKGEEGHLC